MSPVDGVRQRRVATNGIELNVAEAELERDIRMALRKFPVMGAGETDLAGLPAKKPDDDLLSDLPDPQTLLRFPGEAVR